jgi:hypothetical protein
VRHLERHVTQVLLDEHGDIDRLQLDGDEPLAADFFVDCTGFASLLIGKALQTPFKSYSDNLFNDAAVALPSPIEGPISSQTVSTALKSGWAWKIRLTNRYGNGYVYSSAHCSADQPETELRQHLGLLDADIEPVHLRMRVGSMAKHWNRNCVAIGLAQGFIEPLEATALLLVQRTAMALVDALEVGDLGEAAQARFNAAIHRHFEGTRDFIVAHYKTNSRTDTDYWLANAANTNLSDPLRELLGTCLARQPLIGGLQKGRFGYGFSTMSWYALLAGVGVFPDEGLRAPTAAQAQFDPVTIDNLLSRSALDFQDHRELLRHIPPKPTGRALHLYQWRSPGRIRPASAASAASRRTRNWPAPATDRPAAASRRPARSSRHCQCTAPAPGSARAGRAARPPRSTARAGACWRRRRRPRPGATVSFPATRAATS